MELPLDHPPRRRPRLYDSPLCTLRVYGPVQGFKTIFTQQCAFFLSFFYLFFTFFFLQEIFSRDVHLSPPFHASRSSSFTFHTIASQIIQTFVCVWFSTFAKLISRDVRLCPTEGCAECLSYVLVGRAAVNRNYFNGERFRRSSLETK